MQQINDHTQKIAIALNTVGLINVQFAIKDDVVYIIEANPRASRTVPHSESQTTAFVNYAQSDVETQSGDFDYTSHLEGFAIKQPAFRSISFQMSTKRLVQKWKVQGKVFVYWRFKRWWLLRVVRSSKMYLSK